jgi:hypothetical protein
MAAYPTGTIMIMDNFVLPLHTIINDLHPQLILLKHFPAIYLMSAHVFFFV